WESGLCAVSLLASHSSLLASFNSPGRRGELVSDFAGKRKNAVLSVSMNVNGQTTTSKIVILDFGSQYTQVIARRVRECHVYSEIRPHSASAHELKSVQGIILSGGPASVFAPGAPQVDPKIFDLEIPVLGICYGEMLMAQHLGGSVEFTGQREYGSGFL